MTKYLGIENQYDSPSLSSNRNAKMPISVIDNITVHSNQVTINKKLQIFIIFLIFSVTNLTNNPSHNKAERKDQTVYL